MSALGTLLASQCIPSTLPFSYTTPNFHPDRIFASLGGVTLRDPTTALWDPSSESWHVYCTHVTGGTGQGGYPGVIWHWSLKVPFDDIFTSGVEWTSEGIVLNASGVRGAFDASGVFTPAVVRECDGLETARGARGEHWARRCLLSLGTV